jgi:hypothetical protein
VVGELEDVGPQVRARSDEPGLGAGVDVAGQQHASAPGRHPQHQRAMVAISLRLRRRPQHLDPQVPQRERRLPGRQLAHRRARLAGRVADRGERRIAGGARRKPHCSDRNRTQHGGRAPAVVQVAVTDGQRVEAPDPQGSQCRNHRVATPIDVGEARSRVHEQRTPASLDEDGVTLPHVERHEPRAGRLLLRGRRQRQQDRLRRRCDQARTRRAARETQQRDRRRREQECGRRSVGRARDRRTSGDRAHNGQAPRREPLGSACEFRHERSFGRDPDQGRRCQRRWQQHPTRPRHRQGIGGERQRRTATQTSRYQRRGREQRSSTGAKGRDPPAFGDLGRRGQHQRRGGCEREPGAYREERARLEGQEQHAGQHQRLLAARRPPSQKRRHRGRRHQERPPHRKTESRQGRVADEHAEGRRRSQLPGVARARQRQPHGHETQRRVRSRGHEHEVEPGDRQQVREPETGERVARRRVQVSALAHRQRREQRPTGTECDQTSVDALSDARHASRRTAPRCQPLRQQGMHRLPGRADPAPGVGLRIEAAPRVAESTGRAEPQPRAHAIARQHLPQDPRHLVLPKRPEEHTDPVGHRRLVGQNAHDALDLQHPPCTRRPGSGHPRLDRRLDGARGAQGLGGGPERAEVERARRGDGQHGRRGSRAPPGDEPRDQRERAQRQRRARLHDAAVCGEDSRGLGRQQQDGQSVQVAAPRDRGRASLARPPQWITRSSSSLAVWVRIRST